MRRTKTRADTNDLIIGQRVQAAGNSLRLSQRELGQCPGVSVQHVQTYESGQNRESFPQLVRCREILDGGVHDFLAPTGRAPLPEAGPATAWLVRSFAAIKDANARRCTVKVIDAVLLGI